MPKSKSPSLPKNLNPWMIVAFSLLFILALRTFYEIDFRFKPRFQATKEKAVSPTPIPSSSASQNQAATQNQAQISELQKVVLPEEGVELPLVWGDLGRELIAKGVIDKTKFEQLFSQGGRKISEEDRQILEGSGNGSIRMTKQNANFLLDVLWAFGLANKNDVLDKGEMMRDPSRVGNFASTGGWTLGKGKATDYYSKFSLIKLTPQQQVLVENVSKGIYRPCCGNSTHFPDCNHGMAMLGLLELLAANGVTEEQMYKTALVVNSFWFTQTYLELATYFKERGTSWDKVDPKEVLGVNYSSAQGYRQIRSQIKSLPPVQQGGGSCGA